MSRTRMQGCRSALFRWGLAVTLALAGPAVAELPDLLVSDGDGGAADLRPLDDGELAAVHGMGAGGPGTRSEARKKVVLWDEAHHGDPSRGGGYVTPTGPRSTNRFTLRGR